MSVKLGEMCCRHSPGFGKSYSFFAPAEISSTRPSTLRALSDSLARLRGAPRFRLVGMAAKETRAGGLQALDHNLTHPFEEFEA
jgi:hypothetical protein